nr:sigma-54 dependent transcriptional regulator [uncultured Sphingomonas sp.]
MRILFAWIGKTDLDAEHRGSKGPILDAALQRGYDEVCLLANWPKADIDRYVEWLAANIPGQVRCEHVRLSSPNAFIEIYRAASSAVRAVVESASGKLDLTFHLSPGTPIMASVWLLLATSRFPAELIESSAMALNTVDTPFNLPTEILPDLLRDPDRRLAEAVTERPSPMSSFGEIAYRNVAMSTVIELARKAAVRNVPLLIEGESGTGKELLARAVHKASPRSGKLIIVNCGAIPSTLVESRLFGHVRGAFTGAVANQPGCFEEADGGTLFLDEIGELPLAAQVALLRVLQEGEVTRIGESRTRRVDVRVVAATHRDLFADTGTGRFREDLFYRLAVLRIRLPALRERGDDVGLLVDHALEKINTEMATDPLYRHKRLTSAAKQILIAQPWRGNVRELHNTMRRAMVWADGDDLTARDIEDALFKDAARDDDEILNRALGPSFNLDSILDQVAGHYIERALAEAKGNKSLAAKLIGYGSYQRLDARRAKLQG